MIEFLTLETICIVCYLGYFIIKIKINPRTKTGI